MARRGTAPRAKLPSPRITDYRLLITSRSQPAKQYKMTTPIPPGMASPDEVETRLGTLHFSYGCSDKAATEKLYDNLDFQHAVQACLLALPPVNQFASRLALGDIRVGAAVAEAFPGRIHHRAAAGLPGRWSANQSNEVACFGQRNRTGVSIPVRLRSGIRYLAAQVIIVSTIFGTRKSMTEPPRFLPMASMSPDLNLSAAIPIKKGVAAIIPRLGYPR